MIYLESLKQQAPSTTNSAHENRVETPIVTADESPAHQLWH